MTLLTLSFSLHGMSVKNKIEHNKIGNRSIVCGEKKRKLLKWKRHEFCTFFISVIKTLVCSLVLGFSFFYFSSISQTSTTNWTFLIIIFYPALCINCIVFYILAVILFSALNMFLALRKWHLYAAYIRSVIQCMYFLWIWVPTRSYAL